MNSKLEAVRHVIYVIVFLLISAGIYVFSTYLFREVSGNTRRIITAYYSEEPEMIDVVAVGGSGIYRFFDTMLCYRDEGFVAFDYCTASLPAGTILPSIRDVFKTQSPKVLIIDAKRFAPARTKNSTPLVRNILDSFPLSMDRIDAISRYAKLYDLSWDEELAMHLDLLLYHNNTHALLERKHWEMADNRWDQLTGGNYFNGYGPGGGVIPIDTSSVDFKSGKKKTLSKMSENLLRETLEYCKGLDCLVVMVVTPSCESQDSIDSYYAMEDICEEYGVPFFNSLTQLDEMGIDFATDFYNKAHTNQMGGFKFTRYFVNWLKELTDLPDHRGDERYAFFDQLLELYDKKVERNYRIMARKLLQLERKEARAEAAAAVAAAAGAEAIAEGASETEAGTGATPEGDVTGTPGAEIVTPDAVVTGTPGAEVVTPDAVVTGIPEAEITGTPAAEVTGTPAAEVVTPDAVVTGIPEAEITGTPGAEVAEPSGTEAVAPSAEATVTPMAEAGDLDGEEEALSDEEEASSGEEEASSGEENAEDGDEAEGSALSKLQEEKIEAKIVELRALTDEILSNRFFEKRAAEAAAA